MSEGTDVQFDYPPTNPQELAEEATGMARRIRVAADPPNGCDDPLADLLDALVVALLAAEKRAEELGDACEAVGLSRDTSVERFVEHHRNNAAMAASFEAAAEQVAAEKRAEEAEAENERLREALDFYADERRYEIDNDGCAVDWEEYEGDPINHDGGEVARAALVPAKTEEKT